MPTGAHGIPGRGVELAYHSPARLVILLVRVIVILIVRISLPPPSCGAFTQPAFLARLPLLPLQQCCTGCYDPHDLTQVSGVDPNVGDEDVYLAAREGLAVVFGVDSVDAVAVAAPGTLETAGGYGDDDGGGAVVAGADLGGGDGGLGEGRGDDLDDGPLQRRRLSDRGRILSSPGRTERDVLFSKLYGKEEEREDRGRRVNLRRRKIEASTASNDEQEGREERAQIPPRVRPSRKDEEGLANRMAREQKHRQHHHRGGRRVLNGEDDDVNDYRPRDDRGGYLRSTRGLQSDGDGDTMSVDFEVVLFAEDGEASGSESGSGGGGAASAPSRVAAVVNDYDDSGRYALADAFGVLPSNVRWGGGQRDARGAFFA